MKSLILEELTTDQKLGLLLCGRPVTNPAYWDEVWEMIQNRMLGSIQIPRATKRLEYAKKVLETADYPILLIDDMEQGYYPEEFPKLSAMSLSACDDPDVYEAFAKATVFYAKQDGFSGTWGPVLDIRRINAPGIVARCYGNSPKSVLRATEKISDVYHQYGFFATGKHYPGGMVSPYDSHMTESFSDVTEEDLLRFDLVPYLELMKKGLLPAVMTQHSTFFNIDPERPATLSKKVLDILRNQGFDGVYLTDSLAMMGILQKYGEENVYGMCIAAGIDHILVNYRTSPKTCFEMLKKNYLDGAFTEEQLNTAARRVLALQNWVLANSDKKPDFTEKDREVLKNAAKNCITAVTDDGLTACLGDTQKRRLFVIVTPMDFNSETSDIPEVGDLSAFNMNDPAILAAKIKREFPNGEVVFVPEFATASENEKVLLAATNFDEVVFFTFCISRAYLGTDGLTRRTEALINCLNLSGKVSAVVHFGNPYAVEPLDHIKRILFAYTAPESRAYAVEALAGKIPANGKLPLVLNLK